MEKGRYRDRHDAGQRLAAAVVALRLADPIVLALPRGGVPVAAEVARALGAPLDVMAARKIGAPVQPELAVGAIAEGGGKSLDPAAIRCFDLEHVLDDLVAAEQRELERRVARYRGERPLPAVEGRDAVLVDDGLATGLTAEAALDALRRQQPRTLVLAVPVGAPPSLDRVRRLADHIVCPLQPANLVAVGLWYLDFAQTSDEEVVALLAAGRPGQRPGGTN